MHTNGNRFWRPACAPAALILAAALLQPAPVSAQSEVELGIKSTFANQIPLSIQPFTAVDGASADDAAAVELLVTKDLEFSGIFKIIRGSVPLAADGHTGDLVEVRGALMSAGQSAQFEGRVFDATSGKAIGGKRYRADKDQLRQVAHHFSDEIVKMLTGELGVASTKIVFRRKTKDRWEIVMSDYDGYNPQVLLRQSVPAVFPRWIDDSRALTYTSYRYGEADLFIRYLQEAESRRIVSFEGLNYSVDWSERRQEMVATLSKDGDPEIYILDKAGAIKRRLTHSRAIDCSPNWSPSGREILFTSDRTGAPHIYVMEADGSNVRRLTFAGNYNDSPAWSPRGDLIVFVSRIDGFFQLCTIQPDGSHLRQLTDDPTDHEDPRWAPNGRHIAYAEKRNGTNVITIIDISTGGKRILSEGETPDWSTH